jgi:reactive intermediate/imine deaminase
MNTPRPPVPARTELRVEGLPKPISHYTDAVRWGDLLFVSGCAALGDDGSVVAPGDVVAQTRVVHEYLGAALRAGGSDFAHVLKVTVYLRDVADRIAVNEVRKEFFGDALPASTLVEVSSLVLDGLLVEVEAIAGVPG